VYGFNKKALTLLLGKHGIQIDGCRIWAKPQIPTRGGAQDRIRSFVGTQVNRVANASGTASNMYVWGRVTGR
jgi:hypothetical protein